MQAQSKPVVSLQSKPIALLQPIAPSLQPSEQRSGFTRCFPTNDPARKPMTPRRVPLKGKSTPLGTPRRVNVFDSLYAKDVESKENADKNQSYSNSNLILSLNENRPNESSMKPATKHSNGFYEASIFNSVGESGLEDALNQLSNLESLLQAELAIHEADQE